MEKYWETADKNIFEIGGKKIQIAKRGRAQAKQIEELNKWLKEHLGPLAENLKGQDQMANGWQFYLQMMGELSADAQMELAKVLLGTKDAAGNDLPENFIDEYYDIDWVIAALQITAKAGAVQNIINAFFTNIG